MKKKLSAKRKQQEETKEESKEESKEEETPKPEKDYKAALDDLTTIAENAKKINDVDLLNAKKSEGIVYSVKFLGARAN